MRAPKIVAILGFAAYTGERPIPQHTAIEERIVPA